MIALTVQEAASGLAGRFRDWADAPPELVVRSPGRINVIGEHTDYNEGWVLPAAINLGILIAARRRGDGQVRLRSERRGEEVTFRLGEVPPDSAASWARYPAGVIRLLHEGHRTGGMEALIDGDLPEEAGLGSSAALEVGIGYALQCLYSLGVEPLELALLCRRAEEEFAGVPCGVMDQIASRLGRRGAALLLDCRSLEHRLVPLGTRTCWAAVDSGLRRGLRGSAYARRREECAEAARLAVAHMGRGRTLRDFTPEDLPSLAEALPEGLLRRARHVVTENARVHAAAELLRGGDTGAVGEILLASHRSLRDDFEVSTPELDLLVEEAVATPGVRGARLMGAGFGGSVLVLLEEEAWGELSARLEKAYGEAFGRSPQIYRCRAEEGVHVV